MRLDRYPHDGTSRGCGARPGIETGRPKPERLALEGGEPIRREPLPLHRPCFDEAEVEAVAAVIRSGQAAGNGPICREVEAMLRQRLGVRHVLLTSSATAALEMVLRALALRPGDEVICPSFTFSSTANAILVAGGTPVFADIDPETWNLHPERVERLIGPRTRAILPVHYAGQPCALDELSRLAAPFGIPIVTDAAHALGARYRGCPIGAAEHAACFSFHQTKNLVCGEGGALTTDDDGLARAAEIIREKGTDRAAFMRGDVARYTWMEVGSSYVLSDILAAVLREQVKKLDWITRRRTEHAEFLLQELRPLENRLRLPIVRADVESCWHVFAILVPPAHRDWFIKALKAEGVEAAFHFVPLHTSPFGQRLLGDRECDLPVTDAVAASLVRLPLYPQLTRAELADIVRAVTRVGLALPT